MENKDILLTIIAIIVICNLLKPQKNRPYHSDVYSSWEDEQIDEMRADLNYLEDLVLKNKY